MTIDDDNDESKFKLKLVLASPVAVLGVSLVVITGNHWEWLNPRFYS
jgi:hypothetical protein